MAFVLAVTFLYPLFEVIRLSFTNASLVGGEVSYTLDSYLSLFRSPYFLSMIRVTAIFVTVSVVFQMLLGFLIALLVDQGAKRGMAVSIVTVSVGLVNLQGNTDAITLHYLSAASIIAIAPVIAIFVILQRYIVSALTSGAVKG